jgi:pimeloyl-ACP methyl ester carboxylesterase
LYNVEAAVLMIGSRSPNLDEIKTILNDIKLDDLRASKVIHRLRRLLTRGVFDPQDVELNKVVRDVMRIVSAQAKARGVKLDSHLAQQPLRVNGDSVQLQQVILNLIVNGIEALAEMPDGEREIACSSWASDRQALVSIRDTGPGRSPTFAVAEMTSEISLPVALTVFPGENYRAPETWARRAYRNLIYFHEVDKGGHFAAWEQPELFSAELRAAFRPLRQLL